MTFPVFKVEGEERRPEPKSQAILPEQRHLCPRSCRYTNVAVMELKQQHWPWCGVLLLLEGVSLASGGKIMAKAGKSATLPCGVDTKGDIVWTKNGGLLLKYMSYIKASGITADISRFSVHSHSNNNLVVSAVQLMDSGTYTCLKGKTSVLTTELYVFEVSASPSFSPIMSEDLTLKVRLSPEQIPDLKISWTKDGKEMGTGSSLEMRSVDLGDGGDIHCIIKAGDVGESFQEKIKVKGFLPSPAIVYSSGLQPLTIPWVFNFNVQNPLPQDIQVMEGNVTCSSQIVKQLVVNNGARCWSDECDSKLPNDRLDVRLSKPEYGDCRLEVLLKLGDRTTRLWKDVCVAALTVSTSEDDLIMESTVSLLCNINCLDNSGMLCWHHKHSNQICGSPGQKLLSQEVTITPETLGEWICSVTIHQKIEVSAAVTLVVKLGILDSSNYLFRVMIGVCVFLLLLIVVAVSIVTARCRRKRRARQRAWLLQNLHQKRMCECRGFAPIWLKEHI